MELIRGVLKMGHGKTVHGIRNCRGILKLFEMLLGPMVERATRRLCGD